MGTIYKRRRARHSHILAVALDSLPIRPCGSDQFDNISPHDIEIIRPLYDGLVEVVYQAECDLPSGITVRGITAGESTIGQDHEPVVVTLIAGGS